MKHLYLLLLLFIIYSQALSFEYPDTISGTTFYTYKTINGTSLNLQVLKSEMKTAPTMVFFFGGGWRGGTVKQFEPHMRYLMDFGFTTIAVDYRVSSRHHTRPMQSVQDAMDAMVFIKMHAAELHVDTTMIAAAGGSAGGHLAASTALLKHFYPQDTPFSPDPAALILFNPVVNTMPEGFGYDIMGADGWVLSPVHHVTKNLPPTIIFHGTADKTVPFDNILAFEKEMEAIGNRVVVKPFPGRGHAFFNFGRNQNKDYKDTIEMMHKFLQSVGFIN